MKNTEGKGWNHPGRQSSDYGKKEFNDHDRRSFSDMDSYFPQRKFSLLDEIKEIFSRFSDEWPDLAPLNQNGYVPHIDVKEEKDNIIVYAEIPGVKEEDISVSLEKDILTLEGEKPKKYDNDRILKSEISYGRFFRQIPLGEFVDEDRVEASFQDGVLKVILGKKGDAEKRKKIHVNKKQSLQ